MSKFWIDDGSGEDWTQWPEVEATDPAEAVEVWVADWPRAPEWSGGLPVRVRSEDGTIAGVWP